MRKLYFRQVEICSYVQEHSHMQSDRDIGETEDYAPYQPAWPHTAKPGVRKRPHQEELQA